MEFFSNLWTKIFEKLPGHTYCLLLYRRYFLFNTWVSMPFKITLFYHKDWKEYVFIYKSNQRNDAVLMVIRFIFRWDGKWRFQYPGTKETYFSLNYILSWGLQSAYRIIYIVLFLKTSYLVWALVYIDKGNLQLSYMTSRKINTKNIFSFTSNYCSLIGAARAL